MDPLSRRFRLGSLGGIPATGGIQLVLSDPTAHDCSIDLVWSSDRNLDSGAVCICTDADHCAGKNISTGVMLALVISLLLYGLGLWLLEKRFSRSTESSSTALPKRWLILQWFSTAWLWCQWMIQNAASLYVYLPRRLSLEELFLSIAVICAALALIFAWGGGPIQTIIRRKINIHDIRSATLIDLVFGMILFTRALSMSMVPLSTTWVFLGLLAGRELALVARLHQSSPGQAIKQLAGDLFKASIGVGVSLAVASSLQLVLM